MGLKRILISFTLLVFLLDACPVMAQPKSRMERYSTEDGLSHDRVTCMMKDSEGFMWFGTWDGINRFDGHNFICYKSTAGDMSELKNDRIDQIVEDNTNHLWLKAYDGDIYRFDKATEKFLPLSRVFDKSSEKKIVFERIIAANNGDIWLVSKKDGLCYFPKSANSLLQFIKYNQNSPIGNRIPSNDIKIFYEDNEHNIWLCTARGIGQLAKTSTGGYKQSDLADLPTAHLTIKCVTEDAHSTYFGTEQGELIVYNKLSKTFATSKISVNTLNAFKISGRTGNLYVTTSGGEVLTLNPGGQKVIASVSAKFGPLYSIFEDSKGCLWIAPDQQGILRFDPSANTFCYYTQKNDAKHATGSNRFKVFEDNNGVVWVSMKGGGFGYYNPSTLMVDYFYNEPGSSNRRLSNTILDIYYDPAGVIWLNTDERGVDKIVLLPDEFNQHLFVDPGFFKTDNEVRGLLRDTENRVWFGIKSGKLYVYRDNKPIGNIFTNEPKEGLGQVYTIIEDKIGNIWLGTKNNGLYKAEPVARERTKYQLIHYTSDKNDINTLSSNEIYAILEDNNGRIWIGSYDGGLNVIENSAQSAKIVRAGTVSLPYPKGKFGKIRNLSLDGSGNIWIASTDGLVILKKQPQGPAKYQFETYSKIPGDKESLGNNDIQLIFKDSGNRMWLGTSGGGLDLVLPGTKTQGIKFRNYTTKDGLPNDYILSCNEDKAGNLWIATQNGLSRFNPFKNQFFNYDSRDGLPKTTFSEASSTTLSNGGLIFGTVNGYVSFDPATIVEHKIKAKLVYTNIQINNKDINGDQNSKILLNNINYTDALSLPYNQSTISLDYVVLDPRSNLKQTFAYRLQGLDTSWQYNKTQRRITYTNLSPGVYTLEIKNLNSELFSETPQRSLKITIAPPPWRTWWAYLVYFLMVVGVVVVIARTMLTMLRLRHNIAVEKRLAALKMSFFTNVSHELRTPLTLILNPIEEIEKILAREKISGQGNEYIRIVKKNAERMIRFINQLLDLRKVQSGKSELKVSKIEMVSFVKNIAEYFNELSREKNITLAILADYEVIAWADAEKLDIIVYNVLANAFKFTPKDKRIALNIAQYPQKGEIVVTISDQGSGVGQADLPHIFELYFEGNQGDTNTLKGTGIGLALSKELIQLQQGEISAYNNEDGGLTVEIALKSGKEHFAGEHVEYVDQFVVNSGERLPVQERVIETRILSNLPGMQAPTVLLVEDNSDLRLFLKVQLSEYYHVLTAENGEIGLQMAIESIPDLILSDVMMPVMNGIEMLDLLKKNPQTSHIPVVILSAKSAIESQIEGLKYGADHYITKPFNNAFLMTSIESLLEKRKKIFEALLADKKVIHLGPSEVAITTHDEIFLKRIIEIVEDNIANAEFNVDSAAELMNMSRSPFFKKFKSLTNQAPVEFVREMRLKRAKQLFDAGQTKIADIAFSVGFSNGRYFSTCFKEQFGVTPSDYLKSREEPSAK